MLQRVGDVQRAHFHEEPQAFGRWFAGLFFSNPQTGEQS